MSTLIIWCKIHASLNSVCTMISANWSNFSKCIKLKSEKIEFLKAELPSYCNEPFNCKDQAVQKVISNLRVFIYTPQKESDSSNNVSFGKNSTKIHWQGWVRFSFNQITFYEISSSSSGYRVNFPSIEIMFLVTTGHWGRFCPWGVLVFSDF